MTAQKAEGNWFHKDQIHGIVIRGRPGKGWSQAEQEENELHKLIQTSWNIYFQESLSNIEVATIYNQKGPARRIYFDSLTINKKTKKAKFNNKKIYIHTTEFSCIYISKSQRHKIRYLLIQHFSIFEKVHFTLKIWVMMIFLMWFWRTRCYICKILNLSVWYVNT